MCAWIEHDPYLTRAQNGGRTRTSDERTDHRFRVGQKIWTPGGYIRRRVPETREQVLAIIYNSSQFTHHVQTCRKIQQLPQYIGLC